MKFAIRLSEASSAPTMLLGGCVRLYEGKVYVNGTGMRTSARLSGGRGNGA